MKRLSVVFLTISILLVSTLLVSCNQTQGNSNLEEPMNTIDTITGDNLENSDTNEDTILDETSVSQEKITEGIYDIKFADQYESYLFNDSVEVLYINEFDREIVTDVNKTTITFAKENFDVTLNYIDTYKYLSDQKVYISDDGNIQYTIVDNSPSFSIILADNSSLYEHSVENKCSEQSFKQHVENFIFSQIKLESLNEYTYSCNTYFWVHSSNGVSGESKNYFDATESENEEIIYYEFLYQKFCDGVMTDDYIIVECLPNGNIYLIEYSENNVEWSNPFDSEIVKTEIKNYICCNALSTYPITGDFEILSQRLVVVDKKIQLIAEISFSINISDREYSTKCKVILS